VTQSDHIAMAGLDPKEAFLVGLGTEETHHDRPFGSKLRMRTFDPERKFPEAMGVSA
jgi:hypothetical protein